MEKNKNWYWYWFWNKVTSIKMVIYPSNIDQLEIKDISDVRIVLASPKITKIFILGNSEAEKWQENKVSIVMYTLNTLCIELSILHYKILHYAHFHHAYCTMHNTHCTMCSVLCNLFTHDFLHIASYILLKSLKPLFRYLWKYALSVTEGSVPFRSVGILNRY